MIYHHHERTAGGGGTPVLYDSSSCTAAAREGASAAWYDTAPLPPFSYHAATRRARPFSCCRRTAAATVPVYLRSLLLYVLLWLQLCVAGGLFPSVLMIIIGERLRQKGRHTKPKKGHTTTHTIAHHDHNRREKIIAWLRAIFCDVLARG